MPPRSKMYEISDEDRKWLDGELIRHGFGSYRHLTEELQKRGYEISKSAVFRYGRILQKKIDAIKPPRIESVRSLPMSAPMTSSHRSPRP